MDTGIPNEKESRFHICSMPQVSNVQLAEVPLHLQIILKAVIQRCDCFNASAKCL